MLIGEHVDQSWYEIVRSRTITENVIKYNYRCSMLSTDLSTNCAPNFIQNADILVTLGNTSAENKGLKVHNRLQ